jgi:uncharacterized protein with HEPN domain
MQRDPRAFLWDIRESALAIQSFVAELNSDTYASNSMAQAACERKFEIVGEALSQLSKKLIQIWQQEFLNFHKLLRFRNPLIHGYAKIKASTVWATVQSSLPPLLTCVNGLLNEFGEV